ncbi:hypothetical protein M422DRAFT_50756 [Sphaerobolus stellatus SS14]|uniref:Uncharacterized protein n=1 Tax=Sphaerobolus stellatus (strain SS14) TaxID=990650 RepID=A0A0C9U2D1_SPHS4|nr:hypothetical protein M422DRAFT_50756 [Sphaerobolus stellatus SS14]
MSYMYITSSFVNVIHRTRVVGKHILVASNGAVQISGWRPVATVKGSKIPITVVSAEALVLRGPRAAAAGYSKNSQPAGRKPVAFVKGSKILIAVVTKADSTALLNASKDKADRVLVSSKLSCLVGAQGAVLVAKAIKYVATKLSPPSKIPVPVRKPVRPSKPVVMFAVAKSLASSHVQVPRCTKAKRMKRPLSQTLQTPRKGSILPRAIKMPAKPKAKVSPPEAKYSVVDDNDASLGYHSFNRTDIAVKPSKTSHDDGVELMTAAMDENENEDEENLMGWGVREHGLLLSTIAEGDEPGSAFDVVPAPKAVGRRKVGPFVPTRLRRNSSWRPDTPLGNGFTHRNAGSMLSHMFDADFGEAGEMMCIVVLARLLRFRRRLGISKPPRPAKQITSS